jgi:hypothetical protein
MLKVQENLNTTYYRSRKKNQIKGRAALTGAEWPLVKEKLYNRFFMAI